MIPVHEYKQIVLAGSAGDPCVEIPKQEYAGWEFVTMTSMVLSNHVAESGQGTVRKMELVYLLLFRRPA